MDVNIPKLTCPAVIVSTFSALDGELEHFSFLLLVPRRWLELHFFTEIPQLSVCDDLIPQQARTREGFEGVRSNPAFDHIHEYIIQVNIHAYIYTSIRANQVPTQGSAETVLLRSNSKITLLATRTSPVLPLGTHFFVALALLIW